MPEANTLTIGLLAGACAARAQIDLESFEETKRSLPGVTAAYLGYTSHSPFNLNKKGNIGSHPYAPNVAIRQRKLTILECSIQCVPPNPILVDLEDACV